MNGMVFSRISYFPSLFLKSSKLEEHVPLNFRLPGQTFILHPENTFLLQGGLTFFDKYLVDCSAMATEIRITLMQTDLQSSNNSWIVSGR